MAGRQAQLLIGIHSVASALESAPDSVRRVLVADEARNARVRELEGRARELGRQVVRKPRAWLDRHCDDERHQDIAAEFSATNIYSEKELAELLDGSGERALLLVLDGVQDPQNLGACLRTAEAAGVQLVILPRDRSASLTPVARRAACGAAEVMPILYASNLARVLRRLKDAGIWLLGAADQAEQSLYDADLSGPMALVMGSEGKGMRRLTSELCDYRVRIPMSGSVSSLNVSVATGVCLFEMSRQRGRR
jgi:23S rRNA (guanosine2251-2'-O)-methyltransferase